MPPARPILDLSTIDLSATVADRDAIARYNAHRGQMILIDRIIWATDSCEHALAVKHVRDDEFWVDGHIPGSPLMPGVLMVEAAAQLASWMYYVRSQQEWFAGFTRIDDTIFRGQVQPGDDLYIASESIRFHMRRFVCFCQGFVEGRMVFETKISGMAFPNLPNPKRDPLTEEERNPGRGSTIRG